MLGWKNNTIYEKWLLETASHLNEFNTVFSLIQVLPHSSSNDCCEYLCSSRQQELTSELQELRQMYKCLEMESATIFDELAEARTKLKQTVDIELQKKELVTANLELSDQLATSIKTNNQMHMQLDSLAKDLAWHREVYQQMKEEMRKLQEKSLSKHFSSYNQIQWNE